MNSLPRPFVVVKSVSAKKAGEAATAAANDAAAAAKAAAEAAKPAGSK